MDYKIKETVTRENIIADIKSEYRSQMFDCGLATFAGIIVLVFVFIYLKIEEIKLTSNVFSLIILCLVTICVACVFCFFVHLIYLYFTAQNCFITVSDTLKEVVSGKPVHLFSKNHSSIYFRFAAHGYYSIFVRKTYYAWAQYYRMDASALFETATPGDEFHLIILNKKIVCVYNKRMFGLSEKID